jgi:phosphoribosylamine--glycine ligase
MKVLVIGGGGREHAIAAALAEGGAEVHAAMKNRNPGIAKLAKSVAMVKETDVSAVVLAAEAMGVDMAVCGPEAPLEVGLSDALNVAGIPCVGPSKAAARMETSKSFARELLQKHSIPGNLEFAYFESYDDCRRYVDGLAHEVAVKPVGLTGGKGVKVQGEQLADKSEVLAYVKEIFDTKMGGGGVVLEEKAVGEEFTLMAFCDGRDIAIMPLVQDHKRAFEGDLGPNTGGMGSYSAEDHLLPFVKRSERDQAKDIMSKVIAALAKEGMPYKGILYGQFMLTSAGPKVIEFNARFGDPEAMNVLPLLRTPFPSVCEAITSGRLAGVKVEFAEKASVCKYIVPTGYGEKPMADREIKVDEAAVRREGARAFYAAVNETDGVITTTGSRAVGVVGIGADIAEAERRCEAALHHVKGEAIYVRHDIGRPDILRQKVERMARIRGSR